MIRKQHPINIRELINECFKITLVRNNVAPSKMILGSKHVGAILNVLM